LVQDDELDLQLECVYKVLDRLLGEVLVGVRQAKDDDVHKDEEGIDIDQIPFDSANVDFVGC